MDIEVLHIDGCPSTEIAVAGVHEAAASLGLDVTVATRLLRTPEDAAAAAFAGSPTILVDGEDLFPSEGRTGRLACRVYPTDAGLRGAPTAEQINAALRSLPGS
ncbi:hypothetical protein [Microbacterium sp. NPDC057650]|uniref:DF family (seleno)protein n=1 Tax=unclassified Microbacterium TaxID=2609290 RepID=UPI00366BC717